MLPNIIALMAHESSVVHSYAAHCLERMLMVKDEGKPRFAPPDICPFLTQLLTNLFGAFTLGDSAENEYLMKAVMRVIAFVGPEMKPFAAQAQAQIVAMLVVRTRPGGRTAMGSTVLLRRRFVGGAICVCACFIQIVF